MLVDVEGGQPKGELVLELGCKPLLGHVVGALHVQILEGHRVRPEQLVRVARDEGDAEQAAKVVRPGPGGDLETNGFTLFLRNYCKLGVKPLSAPGPCSHHPHPLGRGKHKKKKLCLLLETTKQHYQPGKSIFNWLSCAAYHGAGSNWRSNYHLLFLRHQSKKRKLYKTS